MLWLFIFLIFIITFVRREENNTCVYIHTHNFCYLIWCFAVIAQLLVSDYKNKKMIWFTFSAFGNTCYQMFTY